MWRRTLTSNVFVVLCSASVLLALVPLAAILFFVVGQGISSLNLAFFTQMPKPVGEPGGGMANAIAGTVILTGLGAVFAIPIGILSGVYGSRPTR
jgi:phosphate transport system permease protein